MNESAMESENALRLRALVRVVLSPGVWAIILLQVLVQVVGRSAPGAEEDAGAVLLRMLIGSVAIVAMLYMQAGVLSALARTRGPVSIGDVLNEGRKVFLAFVWLVVRAALLLAAIGIVVGLAAIGSVGTEDPQAIASRLAPFFLATAVLLPFLFVYWLPQVFVHNDFRLFATLKQALVQLWQRRVQSWYLALLILLPALLAGMLPAETPFAIRLVLGGGIMLLAWAANTYCIEWLVSRRSADVS